MNLRCRLLVHQLSRILFATTWMPKQGDSKKQRWTNQLSQALEPLRSPSSIWSSLWLRLLLMELRIRKRICNLSFRKLSRVLLIRRRLRSWAINFIRHSRALLERSMWWRLLTLPDPVNQKAKTNLHQIKEILKYLSWMIFRLVLLLSIRGRCCIVKRVMQEGPSSWLGMSLGRVELWCYRPRVVRNLRLVIIL